jgi:hypothetical protein
MHEGSWQSLAAQQYSRVAGELTGLLAGMDESRLDERMPGFPNPVGWTVWHISRGIDRGSSELTGRTQQWLEGWADVFGREPDPSDTGWRHTAADVAAFRSPSVEVQLGYHSAAQAVVDDYLTTAPDDDALRPVTSPTLGNTYTVETRLARQLYEACTHLGQLTVLRSALA